MTNILLGLASEESPPIAFWSLKCKVVYLRGRNQGSRRGSRLGWCQGWTLSIALGEASRQQPGSQDW